MEIRFFQDLVEEHEADKAHDSREQCGNSNDRKIAGRHGRHIGNVKDERPYDDRNGEQETDLRAFLGLHAHQKRSGNRRAGTRYAWQHGTPLGKADLSSSLERQRAVGQLEDAAFTRTPENGGIDDEQAADDDDASQTRFDEIIEAKPDDTGDERREEKTADKIKIRLGFPGVDLADTAHKDLADVAPIIDEHADQGGDVKHEVKEHALVGRKKRVDEHEMPRTRDRQEFSHALKDREHK